MKSIIINKYYCLFLLIVIFSCKKEIKKALDEKKEKVVHQVKDSLNNVKDKVKDNTPFLYEAITNTRSRVSIHKKPSIESEVVLALPYQTKIKIIAFSDVFDYLEVEFENERYGKYGKWVKVFYKRALETYTGYVFDDFLDYQFKQEEEISSKLKDTVTVFNEKEFVDALSSNRVIWIDTETINIEAYQRNLDYINEYLIIDYNQEMPFSTETHYYLRSSGEESLHSFGLFGYENLEIRGKNKLVNFIIEDSWNEVLKFDSCKNILIDNINFYHQNFDGNTCSGEVTAFENCSDMRFQNVHFDGTGTVGNSIYKSENFTFLNCEYYRNSISAISVTDSKEISIIRADIHDNDDVYDVFSIYDSSDITIAECLIKNNTINDNVFEIRGSPSANIKLENSAIDQNVMENNIIKISKSNTINFLLDNSVITNNISKENDYMIAIKETNLPKLQFNKSVVENNTDFYKLVNDSIGVSAKNNFEKDNIFNQASDSVLTKFNSNGGYITREFKDVVYDSITKELKFKTHLLKGKHRLLTASKEEFFLGFPINVNTKYVCRGNVIDGKLDGLWMLESSYYSSFKHNYQVSFKEGVLHGEMLFNLGKNKLAIRGNYINGKKEGIWEYYSDEGILQKKITYADSVAAGFSEYYYRNGALREQRTDVFNTNGVTTCYYPSGEIESKITYENGRIDIKNSTFFDEKGKKKKAIERELLYIKNKEGKYVSNIDEMSSKYKNKVHVIYTKDNKELIGYQYYLNGKKHGVSKLAIDQNKIKTDSYITWGKGDKLDVGYYENEKIKLGKSWFYYDLDNNLIFASNKIDENHIIESRYNAQLNCLIEYKEFKKFDEKFKFHGVYRKYTDYGKIIKEEQYKEGEKL